MIFLLSLKDMILNLISFGKWGRIQGAKSSGVTDALAGHYTRRIPGKRFTKDDFD